MHGFAYITSIENWIFEKTKFNQVHPNVSNYVIACSIIAEINVISPNSVVWKFCENPDSV